MDIKDLNVLELNPDKSYVVTIEVGKMDVGGIVSYLQGVKNGFNEMYGITKAAFVPMKDGVPILSVGEVPDDKESEYAKFLFNLKEDLENLLTSTK